MSSSYVSFLVSIWFLPSCLTTRSPGPMVMGFPALRWANLTCTWDGLENQGIGPGRASQWLWSSPGQYSPGWSVAFVLALSCPSSPPTAVPTPSRPRPITPHPFLQFAALITAGHLSLLHSHEIPHSNRQLLRPVLCPENYSSVVSPHHHPRPQLSILGSSQQPTSQMLLIGLGLHSGLS